LANYSKVGYTIEVDQKVNQMENQIEIKKVERDGIEFYVSADGSMSGMSMRGLSLFIGLNQGTVSDLVKTIETGIGQNENSNENTRFQRLPNSLKSIQGKVFIGCRAVIENNAKLLNSVACASIIHYYAFENENIKPEVKEQAIHAYRKFAQRGLHEYIKEISGFVLEDRHDELVTLMQQVLLKVTGLETEVKEYHAIREKSSNYPGGDFLLNEWAKPELKKEEINQKLLNSEGVSLEAWLFSKGIILDKSTKHRFASLVAATYKSLKIENPCKGKCNVEGKTKYAVSLYSFSDVPILQMCLNKILS
jgi:hypothetical protein